VEAMLRRGVANASYTWTRVEGASGNQLKNIAEHVLRAGLDIRSFVDVHLGIEHAAGRWLDDANRFPLDDATLVDLRVAKTIRSFTAALEATNLLDQRSAPLGFLVGDDAPYYYPAAGRAFALSLTWKGASR
jgi:outer membrane receptor protein involved in Fe transport